MRKTKKKSYVTVAKPFLMAVIVVLIAAATVYGVVTGYSFFNWYNTSFNVATTQDGEVIEGDAVEGDRVNILLIGVDKSENLSDTIMLVSVDSANKKVSVMSILRDTRVDIVGEGAYKINALISTKNKERATINAVKALTGDVPINYYVTVKTKAFRDVIDLLDGVEYDVPHVPNKFSNGRRGMYYEDPFQDLHIAIKEGKQVLDGEDAEGLVRFRDGYAQADEERVKVQQDFLREVAKQKLSVKYINRIPQMYRVAKKNIKTNIKPTEVFTLAKAILGMDMDDIATFSLPGEAAYVGGASYFIADTKETAEIMREYFMDPEE